MRIRAACAEDVPPISAIYATEVHEGFATFDTEPPSSSHWATQVADSAPGHHMLVAEEGHAVLGFAYSVAYRPRGAYAATKETSIYLDRQARGRGCGRLLYSTLLGLLTTEGMHSAVAVISRPNDASEALHASLGFRQVGTLSEVGHKLGRWIDTGFWQLML